ncbi:MAG: DNA topoisomerase IB [Gemmatimonadota bacterium]
MSIQPTRRARAGWLRDERIRERLEALAIPPAWTDVWISPKPRGHLQAVGRDDRARKQYLYHEAFRRAREALKFRRLVPFGDSLPGLRRRVGRDLARDGLPRSKVLAAGVRILDHGAIRVGGRTGRAGERHFRPHDSPPATPRSRLRVGHSVLRGQGGTIVEVELTEPDLIDVLRECDDLPGYRIFQYGDDEGQKREVEAQDVNGYLRETLEGPFTAKDFRTWAGTVRAVSVLAERDPGADERERRSTLVEAAEDVAEHLHNTPAISRQSYIHPRVEELFLERTFHRALDRARVRLDRLRTPGRRREECVVLGLLGLR